MFGKPRFRSSGPSATDMSSKASFNMDREAGQEPRPGEDDTISVSAKNDGTIETLVRIQKIYENNSFEGTFSVQKTSSIESENSHTLKRPISSQQKLSSSEKRDLKRTTSLIPRVAIQRSKTPSGEAPKTVRKSETSLKSKETFSADAPSTKDKKCESRKSSRTGMMGQTDSDALHEKSKKPEGQRNAVVMAKGLDHQPRDQSYTRTTSKVVRRAADSRSREKTEGRAIQRTNPNSSPDVNQGLTKNMENQYTAKKTAYGLMIKEFREKQKAIREHYRILEELRKKIQMQTGKEIQPEEMIKIHEIRPPSTGHTEEAKKNPDLTSKRVIVTFETRVFTDMNIDFTEFHNTFESPLSHMHEMWLSLILTLMNNRKELIKKIMELNPEQDVFEFEKDGRTLTSALEKAKCHTKVKVDNLTEALKKIYVNRERLKQELKVLMDSEAITNLVTKEYKEMAVRIKELDEELVKEKIRTEDLMEKRKILESTNLANLEKIGKLEQAVIDQQTQLEQISSQCKNLKKKELMANRGMSSMKAKDLKAKSELLKALENHITELTNGYNAEKKSFQERITELEHDITEKEEALKAETEARQTLESSLAEAEEKIRNVREKKKVFADMVDKTKQIIQTANSGSTKRDEQLWMELEATKVVVKGYQEQINKITDEKNKLLLKFQTISEDKSNKNAERLAADLVTKEDIINSLKEQVMQLQTACEEHTAKYNKLLTQVKEVHEKMDGKSDIATLSKQLAEVKMQKKELQEVMKELVTHNEELETALVQRSLELDQRDRLVKQQCNLLKMRDELTDLVRSKDDVQYQEVKKAMEQSTKWEKKAEKIFKDLEKKANELDGMYSMLVDKQKQVEKLTKLIKIMEDQQDRAQEQRVRFETKINDLQRQLIEGKLKTPKSPLFGN